MTLVTVRIPASFQIAGQANLLINRESTFLDIICIICYKILSCGLCITYELYVQGPSPVDTIDFVEHSTYQLVHTLILCLGLLNWYMMNSVPQSDKHGCPSVAFQWSIIFPSVTHQCLFSVPSVSLQCPFSIPSVSLQWHFSVPSATSYISTY